MLHRAKFLVLMFVVLQGLLFVFADVLVDALFPATPWNSPGAANCIRLAAAISVVLPGITAFYFHHNFEPFRPEWSYLLALWCGTVGFLTTSGFFAVSVWRAWPELQSGLYKVHPMFLVIPGIVVIGVLSVGAATVAFVVVGILRGWFKAPPGFAEPRVAYPVDGGNETNDN